LRDLHLLVVLVDAVLAELVQACPHILGLSVNVSTYLAEQEVFDSFEETQIDFFLALVAICRQYPWTSHRLVEATYRANGFMSQFVSC